VDCSASDSDSELTCHQANHTDCICERKGWAQEALGPQQFGHRRSAIKDIAASPNIAPVIGGLFAEGDF